ncbi:MAG: SUMF1/EgtB/PvdO family nonheme iron enzyme [Anaerolinea sp.]|nr:SUMF1/EgtB/PvdO family nonheme iron enzyme [Anaerolinea sp.]
MSVYSRAEISHTIRRSYEQYEVARQAYEQSGSDDDRIEYEEAREVLNYWIAKADELGFYPFQREPAPQTLATPFEQRIPTVMLSYSPQDGSFVAQLKKDLQAEDYAVWADAPSIKSDEIWSQATSAGVNNSYAFITVVSRAATTDKWVERECRWAHLKEKPIYIIQIEDCKLPDYLIDIDPDATDFFGDYQTGFSKLLGLLPRPSGQMVAASSGKRELELAYLEALSLERWLKTIRQTAQYTPLAGHAQGARVQRASELIPIPYKHITHRRFILGDEPHTEAEPTSFEPRQYPDILSAIREIRRAVLLGEPGAGKTTTLWRLAMEMVETAQRDPTASLPILLRLGKWTDADQTLSAFIQGELGALGIHFETLLEEKRAALLLDGLNEIPVAQRRAGKDTQVQALFKKYPDLTTVVSCREHDYTLDLGFDRIVIVPLDPSRILEFVTRYLGAKQGKALFWRLAGGEKIQILWNKWHKAGATLEMFFSAPEVPHNISRATNRVEDALWREKVRGNKGSLMTLARNPYLLMMMTDLFQKQGTLPDNQSELFTQFVDELIKREGDKMTGREEELLRSLARIAYTMQTRRERAEDSAEGDECSAATSLPLKEARPALISDELLYLAGSASLLSVSGDSLRFSHQLLQEYFAATYMLGEIRAGRLKASALWPPDRWWERTGWEEAAVLLAGLHSADCTSILEWLGDANPEVAAACITRSGAVAPEATLKRLQERWLPRLTANKREPQPRARAAVGRALGLTRLDNRPGVLDFSWGQDYWCPVPKGEFSYQGKPDKIDYNFWIARYPITYAQFQLFIDAPDGYRNPEWWKGLHEEGIQQQQKGAREQAFKFWNHPRETVSWYEAVAFCRWLDALTLLRPASGVYPLPTAALRLGEGRKCQIRLPLEMEWEKAASWDAKAKKAQVYPWGDTFDPTKANTREGKQIGQTTAVGIYPQGSPCGALDMSGNVWEWCLNDYEGGQTNIGSNKTRGLRGGGWYYGLVAARAAYRSRYFPYLRSNGRGFRVVVAPVSL